jgi:hypothetical protein
VTGVDGSDAADGRLEGGWLADGDGPGVGDAAPGDAAPGDAGEVARGEVIVAGFDGPPDEPCAPPLAEQAQSGSSAAAARSANERMNQCGR